MNDTLASPEPVPLAPARWGNLVSPPQRPRRPIVLVLGMHRSGTSLCAHLLSALGIDMADEIDAHPSNPKGHWERREIVALHDRILDHFNRGYYSPYHDFGLPVAWWADPRVADVRREIVAFLTARMGAARFGFKDPRTVRLLPIWHQIFSELDLEPRIISCLRNPAQVARSLHARDGLATDLGELRWFAYVTDFYRHTRHCDICTIEYETWFADPAANLAKLRNFIGPARLEGELDADQLIAAIVDEELRHDDRQHRRARLPLVRSLYGLARRADRDPAARDQILTIATQYVSFEQMQAVFHRDFERNTALALRVPELEAEVAAFRGAREERAAAVARAEESAARESAALAELEKLRALVPRQRIAAQLAAAEAVHAELARLRAALAAAERSSSESRAERDSAEQAFSELSEALAGIDDEIRTARRREADLTSRLAERTAAAAAAHDELARLHVALADAERLADEIRASDQRELAEARASAADLADRLAASAAKANAAAARESAARAEIDKQRTALGELSRQRDAAQDDAARLRAALAAAEAAEKTRPPDGSSDAAAAAMIADLTKQLTERTRAATAAEFALQGKIDVLYAQLAAVNARLRQGSGWRSRIARRALRRRAGPAIRAGDRALQAGDAAAAARHYRRAVARRPELTAIWVQLGHALKEIGDYGDAEAAYRRALALDGSVADTHLQLGRLLQLLSRWAEAADAYARALQLDPTLQQAAAELDGLCPRLISAGDKARDAQDWRIAAGYYRRVLDHQPDAAAIWLRLGHMLKEQGDHSGAETAYRRSLALDDKSADTHLQLGHLLKRMERWAEAADAFARARQLDPALCPSDGELAELCRNLVGKGEAAGDAGDWAAAIRCYRRALHEQPGAAVVWQRLGRALTETGELAAAETAYRRALALDEGCADTHLALGGVLELQGGHSQAIDAYAGAVRLDPGLGAAREALRALVVPTAAPDRRRPPSTPPDHAGHDVIWLGVIDWHYRIQRPQHLAANLADMGGRVFYVSLGFEPLDGNGRFRIAESPHAGVFEVKVRIARNASESLYRGLGKGAVVDLQLALDELVAVFGLRAPIVVVDHPGWHQVALGVPGATVVYDCLDLATGFSTAAASTASFETAMLADADLVIAASRPLVAYIAQYRPSILVRNAADVELFAEGYCERPAGERPVIGYFGAIAEWLNIAWIEHAAAARPDWEFRLVGRTDGCDTSHAAQLPNVRFLGEMAYADLPRFLRDVDVAVIPFKMIELIRCTNPVKLYEYMAAGKAVVAAPMPEVIEATDLVYIADDAQSFVDRIAQALAEDNTALRLRRLAWARQHTWPSRARRLRQAVDAGLPLVSVVVLTYNNWEHTSACLSSLLSLSDYPNFEIIVIDNASTDETRERLRSLARQDERVRVLLNDANLGFAAGNNVGLRLARGEFVILLNNDTVVTRGWMRDLIRPMQRDPRIGLAGPLTNAIGNEQKVRPGYGAVGEMHEWARRFVRRRLRRTVETGNLAFFCVAIRRSVLDEVGLLDEAYGIGFFEDDDYCRRARQANYQLVIADDVFVHHHLSLSFAPRGSEANDELMARNRAIFEERWGPWQPHRYRDEPGFG